MTVVMGFQTNVVAIVRVFMLSMLDNEELAQGLNIPVPPVVLFVEFFQSYDVTSVYL